MDEKYIFSNFYVVKGNNLSVRNKLSIIYADDIQKSAYGKLISKIYSSLSQIHKIWDAVRRNWYRISANVRLWEPILNLVFSNAEHRIRRVFTLEYHAKFTSWKFKKIFSVYLLTDATPPRMVLYVQAILRSNFVWRVIRQYYPNNFWQHQKNSTTEYYDLSQWRVF